jgi:predicted nucleic acid-binding protein
LAFVVVDDACVLYPAPLRDLLMRLAVKGLVRARWTDQILDECFRNILANRPELNAASLQRTRDLMNRAIRDVMVTGHEGLIAGLDLPDPDDRHVLAAAIRAGAQVIVTANLSDFPNDKLGAYSVEAQHPDEFVLHLLDLAPGVVCATVSEQAASLKNPPRTLADLLDTLRDNGLVQTVARLRELFGA